MNFNTLRSENNIDLKADLLSKKMIEYGKLNRLLTAFIDNVYKIIFLI